MVDRIRHGPGQPTRTLLQSVAWMCGAALATTWLVTTLIDTSSPAGQWDFESYYYASLVRDAGGDPYDSRQMRDIAGKRLFPFVYPYHTLRFFRLFALGDLSSAKAVYLGFKLVCFAGLTFVWLKWFIRPGGRLWFLLFMVLGYNAALCADLETGNVSMFEQLLIWGGVLALCRGRPWVFAGMIVLAAQFKILPAALLALVLLTDRPDKWRVFAGGIAACGLILAGVCFLDPETAQSCFAASKGSWSTERGAINPCAPALIADIVSRLAAWIPALDDVPRQPISMAIYVGCAVFLLVRTHAATRRNGDVTYRIYVGILAYALVAPRMKDYSFLLLLVPTFELLRGWIRQPSHRCGWLVLLPVAMVVPGFEIFWPYRALLLAGITWAIAQSAVADAGVSAASEPT